MQELIDFIQPTPETLMTFLSHVKLPPRASYGCLYAYLRIHDIPT